MNVSVYIPDSLEKRLQEYLEKTGINRNAAIRQALESMLDKEQPKKWGSWMEDFEGDPNFPSLEDLRKDLKEPPQIRID